MAIRVWQQIKGIENNSLGPATNRKVPKSCCGICTLYQWELYNVSIVSCFLCGRCARIRIKVFFKRCLKSIQFREMAGSSPGRRVTMFARRLTGARWSRGATWTRRAGFRAWRMTSRCDGSEPARRRTADRRDGFGRPTPAALWCWKLWVCRFRLLRKPQRLISPHLFYWFIYEHSWTQLNSSSCRCPSISLRGKDVIT